MAATYCRASPWRARRISAPLGWPYVLGYARHPRGDRPVSARSRATRRTTSDRVRHFVTEAARSGVEIIAFPEMCLTGYWHVRKLSREAFEALAEPVPDGPCTVRSCCASRASIGMTIGAGLIERADDGRILQRLRRRHARRPWAVHRKLHVFESDSSPRVTVTRSSTRRTAAGWAC